MNIGKLGLIHSMVIPTPILPPFLHSTQYNPVNLLSSTTLPIVSQHPILEHLALGFLGLAYFTQQDSLGSIHLLANAIICFFFFTE